MLIITLVYIARGRKNAGTGGSKRDTRPSRASRSDAFFAFRAISINSVKIKKKKEMHVYSCTGEPLLFDCPRYTCQTFLECFCSTNVIYAQTLSVWKLKRESVLDRLATTNIKS